MPQGRMPQPFAYRRELDGLRAIAVLAVVVYHAELAWRGWALLPGGFLGVDVFFVLSGYLITGVLLERQPGLLQFYRSRFHRIVPAFVLLLLLCCVPAYLWLVPRDILPFSDSLKGALGFYSNYVFLHEDAYAADVSSFKPLLHTWSLGVEWQFYLSFPIFILLLKRFCAEALDAVLLLCAALSFFYCLQLASVSTQQAFFSTPARVWELFAGSVVYVLARKCRPNPFSEVLASAGLILIAYSFCFFWDSDPGPGFLNLVAVLGTSLVILQTYPRSLVHKLLTLRAAVFFGVLSYSLYLVHQPVLAFYRIAFGTVTNKTFVALFVLMLGLAYASYRLVENPLRRGSTRRSMAWVMVWGGAAFAFANGAHNTNGYPKRLPEQVRSALESFSVPEYKRLEGQPYGVGFDGKERRQCIHRTPETACVFGVAEWPKIITTGDSFAGVFDYALHEALGGDGLLAQTYEQCPLLVDPIWFGNVPECWEINKRRWAILQRLPPAAVLVGTNFHQFFHANQSHDSFSPGDVNRTDALAKEAVYASFRGAITKLVALGHKPIVLLQPPHVPMNVAKEFQRRVQEQQWIFHEEYGATADRGIDAEVRAALLDIPGVIFIDLHEVLCRAEVCLTFNRDGGLFNNGSHLSAAGVRLLLPKILQHLH